MTTLTQEQRTRVERARAELEPEAFSEWVRGAVAMAGGPLKEEDLTTQERTALEFQATLKDVKVDIPKDTGNSWGSKPNGGILLTLRIDRPKPPERPRIPHEVDDRAGYGALTLKRIGKEPTRKKPKETDDEFEERRIEYVTLMNRRAGVLARHQAELEDYERKQAKWGDVLRAYASITGLAAAFGDSPIQVSLTPLQTDFFAGMGVLTLPAPDGEGVPSLDVFDDDEDDEDEDFGATWQPEATDDNDADSPEDAEDTDALEGDDGRPDAG